VKQLVSVIQGHSFGDHRKAIKGLYMLHTYPRYPA